MSLSATPYSQLKIFAHPEKLNAIKRGELTAPIYVRIKPTNACNHRCNYCHYAHGQYLDLEGINARDQIPWVKMQEIINDLGDTGVKAITFSGGGEPLVYPKIVPAMKLLLERGLDISIITNGQLLKNEAAEVLTQAKWVRISLDAGNGDTYARIRDIPSKSFDEVCSNINRFAKIKPSNCELGINFVVNQENADQVYEAGRILQDLGVNHIKFTARMTNDVTEYHKDIRENVIEQINRVKEDFVRPGFSVINLYEEDFKLCAVFHRTYSKCVIKDIVTVIAADSKVYFCHDKAYLANGVIGDLQNRSFKDLWMDPKTSEKFQGFDAEKECRHHCVYDERNILLNTFLSLDSNHINFI
ncbi:MAG: radical SAM protein [Acidobacteriota bacterium]